MVSLAPPRPKELAENKCLGQPTRRSQAGGFGSQFRAWVSVLVRGQHSLGVQVFGSGKLLLCLYSSSTHMMTWLFPDKEP